MKHIHKIFSFFALVMFTLAACTNEEAFILPESAVDAGGTITCRMVFDGSVDGYGATTRAAVGHKWEDGDRLYIRFLGGGSTVTGCAVYSAGGGWTLNLSATPGIGDDKECEVYYFENATYKSNTEVTLTAHSAVYHCPKGSYGYNGEDLYLSAQLSPMTGRVRFVSDSEQSFLLKGISFYTSFNLSKKEFLSSSSMPELLTAQEDVQYSTGYIYGFYTDESTRGIEIHTDTAKYSRKFPLSMLQAGMSGYITLPSVDSYDGWEIIPTTGSPNAYDWVDLGLPSGLKWATCNVGATNPEEYGGYYAWGETEEKSNYDWKTYKWCNGSSTTMTKYCTDSDYGTVDNKTVLDPSDDVAHVKWGGSWRMPTLDEIKELVIKCNWQWTSLNGVDGYRVTGPNGNSIFLPAAGYRYGTELYLRGANGLYWSSSLSDNYCYSAYGLLFNVGNYGWYYDFYRNHGRSVRPVSK